MFMIYIFIDFVMDKGWLIELNLVYIVKVDVYVNIVILNFIYFFWYWLMIFVYIVLWKNKL